MHTPTLTTAASSDNEDHPLDIEQIGGFYGSNYDALKRENDS